jgi:hypothetical protein
VETRKFSRNWVTVCVNHLNGFFILGFLFLDKDSGFSWLQIYWYGWILVSETCFGGFPFGPSEVGR